MLHAYVGIDVAKLTLWAHLSLEDGRYWSREFANTDEGIGQLIRWIAEHAPGAQARVCLEATGTLGRLCSRAFAKEGFDVRLMNPAQARDLASGLGILDKSDRVDARVLARCAELGLGREGAIPSKIKERLQDISRRIDSLTVQRAAEKTRLKNPSIAEEAKESLRRHIAFLTEEIEALEALWKNIAQSSEEIHERFCLLKTVAGIGDKTARVLTSELPEELSPRKAAGYAGLAPRERSSGTRLKGKERIRGGNPRVRKALFLAAGILIRLDIDARSLHDRLVDAGKDNRLALIAVANKLARWVAAVLTRKTPWIPTQHVLDNS